MTPLYKNAGGNETRKKRNLKKSFYGAYLRGQAGAVVWAVRAPEAGTIAVYQKRYAAILFLYNKKLQKLLTIAKQGAKIKEPTGTR